MVRHELFIYYILRHLVLLFYFFLFFFLLVSLKDSGIFFFYCLVIFFFSPNSLRIFFVPIRPCLSRKKKQENQQFLFPTNVLQLKHPISFHFFPNVTSSNHHGLETSLTNNLLKAYNFYKP